MNRMGSCTVLTTSVIFAFVGCGSLAPGGAVTGAGSASYGKSWMLPEDSGDDLLYVLKDNYVVNVYSYPDAKFVETLTGFEDTPTGLCADEQGDVFVTEEDNVSGEAPGNRIVEFAHGGTSPIANLTDSDFPWSCSVDPTTGDLAVTNWVNDTVAIYPNAQGNPTYIATSLSQTYWAAYDNDGNLFVSGNTGPSSYGLAELPSGSGTFRKVSLNESIGIDALQWTDGDLIVSYDSAANRARNLYRIQISGTEGKIVGTTVLDLVKKPRNSQSQFLILGNAVLAAASTSLQRWHYPSGGKAVKTLVRQLYPEGIVLSKAPSRK